MSDFFTHLLQRHQGQSPRVEPRPRARFEADPLAAGMSIPLGPPEAPSAFEVTREQPPQPTPWPVAPVPAGSAAPPPEDGGSVPRALPATPLRIEKDHTAGRDQPAAKRPTPAAAPRPQAPSRDEDGFRPVAAPRILIPESTLLVAPPLPPATNPRTALSDQVPAAAPSPRLNPNQGRPRPQTPDQDDTGPGRRASPLPSQPEPESMPSRPAPAAEPASPLPSEPQHPVPPAPSVAPAADPNRGQGLLVPPTWSAQLQSEFERRWERRAGNEQPEPTIQVTIGRVEVRAEAPPVPAAPKPKAPAVMSLADYLEQRKGRGSL
jgi:hypothetical protein